MSEWLWIVIAVLGLAVVVVGRVVGGPAQAICPAERALRSGVRTHGRRAGRTARRGGRTSSREKKHKKLDITALTPEARQEHRRDLAARCRPISWTPRRTRSGVPSAGDAGDARARLSDRRLRPARRRHLGRPPRHCRELPRCARDLPVEHDGDISTEDARQAFVHYRALFDRLLGSESEITETGIPRTANHRRQTHDHA